MCTIAPRRDASEFELTPYFHESSLYTSFDSQRSASVAPQYLYAAQPNTLGLVSEEGLAYLGPGISTNTVAAYIRAKQQPPSPPQIDTYQFATGWVQKASGEYEYVAPGTLEEVDEDAAEETYDQGTAPDEEVDDDSEFMLTKPLSPSVAPPPAPELNKHHLELLPDSPTFVSPLEYSIDDSTVMRILDAFHGYSGPSSITSGPEEQDSTYVGCDDNSPLRDGHVEHISTLSFVDLTLSSPGVMERFVLQDGSNTPRNFTSPTQAQLELDVVSQNLDLLRHAAVEVDEFGKELSSQGAEFDLQAHVDAYKRVAAAVETAISSLKSISSDDAQQRTRRTKGSSDWHKQFMDRSESLQRTVTRLRSLVRSMHPPRFEKLQSSLAKLEEHEVKLLNLSTKFESSSKRLKVRSIQAQIAKAHAESHYARTSPTAARFALGNERRVARRNSRPYLSERPRRPSVSG
ncbi:hypothetical protein HGRIS_001897 [Hohenbuehelia grisea]|uniref:Uncharacterized protein n=1 Tax=Hohenbuehelia grisea TaxID=104357 RepID=A0ABR3JJH9_9AGAR